MPSIVQSKKIVIIPKVTGLPIEDGSKIIKEAGLQYQIAGEQFSYDYPTGTIIKQTPEAFSKVKIGRRIYLTISKGREVAIVPYLIGQNYQKAVFMLMERGFILGDTTYEHSELYEKDTIIAQSKRAGSTAFYGDTIDLVISLGSISSVEMPQLIGKSIEEAEELLHTHGLIIGATHYIKNDGTYLPHTVINQTPKANEIVRKGSEVYLIVVGK